MTFIVTGCIMRSSRCVKNVQQHSLKHVKKIGRMDGDRLLNRYIDISTAV